MTEDVMTRFHSTRSIGRILIVLLWVLALLGPVALMLGYIERSVLHDIKELSFASDKEMHAAAQTSDRNMMIIGILQLIVAIASIIVWFMWVFRSNKLARALGATAMKYSPGWSVGWFFVPIMNLFKPYFAMKEIFLATMDPKGFDTEREVEDQPESLNIMKLWWLVYLVDSWLV
jgi:heme/copper-type cytochrome/quinol oxidase subunit 2